MRGQEEAVGLSKGEGGEEGQSVSALQVSDESYRMRCWEDCAPIRGCAIESAEPMIIRSGEIARSVICKFFAFRILETDSSTFSRHYTRRSARMSSKCLRF